jgi:hypothetical protein
LARLISTQILLSPSDLGTTTSGGRFPFDEKFWFEFPEVSSERIEQQFFEISGKEDNLAKYTQIF